MVVPKLVGDQLKFILDVCQVGSHTQSDQDVPKTKPSITEVERWNLSHHLLEAATLMTLDFIVWTKAYVEANPNPVQNMDNWEPICQCEKPALLEVEGEVFTVNRGGNAFVKTDQLEETGRKNICIGNWLVKNNEIRIGARVRVTTSRKLLDNGALAADSFVCL
jgi:hypothetical protein